MAVASPRLDPACGDAPDFLRRRLPAGTSDIVDWNRGELRRMLDGVDVNHSEDAAHRP
jgi:hypothetical protein